jgi:hypothetical protein
MDNTIFSGSAQVEIQGDRVLRFRALKNNRAEYRVIGFKRPTITVHDYRTVGLGGIAHVLNTGDVDDFACQFNVPAYVIISRQNFSSILIELRESDDPHPTHTLWIAIGIQGSIPVFDYLFEHIEFLGDNRFAFLGLYRRKLQLEHPLRVSSAAI